MIEVYVKGQNAVVEFPDGMPENEIHSVMEKHFGGGLGAEAPGPSPLFAIDEPGTLGERISKIQNPPEPRASDAEMVGMAPRMAPAFTPRAAEDQRVEQSRQAGMGILEGVDISNLTRMPLEQLLPEQAPVRGRNKYEDAFERGLHGFLRGGLQAASFVTSLEGLGALKAAKVAPRLVGAAFATEGARGIGPAVVEAQEAIKARDPGRIGKSLVDVPMNLLMLGAGPGKMVKDFGEKGKIVQATPGERGITPGVDETAGEHGGFRQFVLGGPKAIVEKSKFLEGKKLEKEQVMGRLDNLAQKGDLSPAELNSYREGLSAFLDEAPRTTKEIADKMDELAPQVEVKVLRSSGLRSQTVEQLGTLRHELDTTTPNWQTMRDAEIAALAPEVQEKINRATKMAEELQTPISQSFDPDQYRSIAPKDADQDVVMVRVPAVEQKLKEGEYGIEGSGVIHQGNHWGAEDKNVLGWARIQWEKTAEGKKVAHIIEVQSDWGQKQRGIEADIKERAARQGITPEEYRERFKHIYASGNHPLLKDYPRLTLKAAIDYARKNGADAVALSDAQTAMMSEGHDAVAAEIKPATLEEVAKDASNSAEDMRGYYGEDYRNGTFAKFNGEYFRVDKPQANFSQRAKEIARDIAPYAEKGGNYIPQEPGMTLNYDKILPRTLEELTGRKGEPVDFGEHQRAVSVRYLHPELRTPEARDERDYARMTETPEQTEYWRNRREEHVIEPRKGLIFKDASGKPKTTATARLYDISHLREKQFSLFGKDVERTPAARPGERGAIEWNPLARWQGKKGGGRNVARQETEEKGQGLLGRVSTLAGGEVANPPPAGPNRFSERGAITTDVLSWYKRRQLKGDTIPAAMDTIDNSANVYSKQTRNWIESKAKDTLGRQLNKQEAEALAMVVEANGDIKNLDRMRNALLGVNTKQANRVRAALKLAGTQWGKLLPIAQRYSQEARRQVDAENIRGIDTIYREGYVPHMWDLRQELDLLFESGGGGASGFMKQRKYDTLASAVANGLKPVSLNAFDLLEHRLRVGNKMAGKVELVDSLKKVNDPFTKQPIFADVGRKVRMTPTGPRGSQAVVPKGYVATFFGNQPVAVLKQYSGLFKALNGESIFNESVIGKALMEGVGFTKHTILLFDLFHMGRLAFYGLSTGGFKAMRFNKGLSLLDFDEATLGEMARRGEIPAKWLNNILEDKRIIGLGIRTGYNIGRISDNLYTTFLQKLPGIGTYNRFLFNRFQRGVMANVYLSEFRRLKEADPGKADAEIARNVSRDLNKRFGNLMNQSWVKNKTMTDIMRIFLLAPQWNEGLLRTELGSMGQTGKAALSAVTERRLVVGSLMKSAGTLFAAYFIGNQLINMLTRGKPTWENPEEGINAKISAWIPDKLGSSKGMFLNPMSLVAEISHQFSKQIEKRQSLRRGVHDVVSFKLAPMGRFLDLLWTGENWKGKRLTDSEVLKEAALMAPIPMQAPTVYHAVQGKEEYPGEAQKTALSMIGIKPEIIQPPQTGGIKRTGVSRNATRRKAIRR
jgi:hypothetical protein